MLLWLTQTGSHSRKTSAVKDQPDMKRSKLLAPVGVALLALSLVAVETNIFYRTVLWLPTLLVAAVGLTFSVVALSVVAQCIRKKLTNVKSLLLLDAVATVVSFTILVTFTGVWNDPEPFHFAGQRPPIDYLGLGIDTVAAFILQQLASKSRSI
jgi:tellurite resistance protein TehA-like permease